MVLAMLTFLDETRDGPAIDFWTIQYQTLLMECLGKDETTVYDESTYTFLQRSLIADLVAIAMLNAKAIAGAGATDANGNPVYARYLKKAKAGSAEAEFGIVTNDEKGLSMSFMDMVQFFKNSAYAKAAVFPCSLTFLGPTLGNKTIPFIVMPWTCYP